MDFSTRFTELYKRENRVCQVILLFYVDAESPFQYKGIKDYNDNKDTGGNGSMKIRPIEVKDAERIVGIMRQKTVLPNIIALPSLRIEKFESRLKNSSSDQHDFVAEVDGMVVGLCGLSQGTGRRAHTGTLFLFIDENFHSKGIGTRLLSNAIDLADNWLMIERIELTVIESNTRAKTLYERIGFSDEGFKHGSIIQNGQYVGECCMARYRPGGAVKRGYDKLRETQQIESSR